MDDSSRTRIVSDVDIDQSMVRVRSPFRIDRDHERRYVRLEILLPMSLRKVKEAGGEFHLKEANYNIDGEILNISGGGVLVDLNESLTESDVVIMRFELQGTEVLDNVLGLVKRVDRDDNHFLVGIEFVNREQLTDLLSNGELELLAADYANFSQRVQEVLGNYVYQEY